jgi:hypothetical protein
MQAALQGNTVLKSEFQILGSREYEVSFYSGQKKSTFILVLLTKNAQR